MKVLLINGSPNEHGCTYTALSEVAQTLHGHGIKTELLYLGKKPVAGCIACGGCGRTGKCVFDDQVNDVLSRLDAKQAVYYEEGLRAKQYYPAVTREEAIREESESVLEKVGSVGLLMSAMVESQRLTESDLAELSAILERAKEGRT